MNPSVGQHLPPLFYLLESDRMYTGQPIRPGELRRLGTEFWRVEPWTMCRSGSSLGKVEVAPRKCGARESRPLTGKNIFGAFSQQNEGKAPSEIAFSGIPALFRAKIKIFAFRRRVDRLPLAVTLGRISLPPVSSRNVLASPLSCAECDPLSRSTFLSAL